MNPELEVLGKLRTNILTREVRFQCGDVADTSLFPGLNETSHSLPATETAAYLPPPFSQLLGLPLSSLSSFSSLLFFCSLYPSAHPPLICSIYFWYL